MICVDRCGVFCLRLYLMRRESGRIRLFRYLWRLVVIICKSFSSETSLRIFLEFLLISCSSKNFRSPTSAKPPVSMDGQFNSGEFRLWSFFFLFFGIEFQFLSQCFNNMILFYRSQSFFYVLADFDSEDEEIPMNMFQSCKCLLVTDNEMGDLLFQLLGRSFFPSSKENYQVCYMQHYHLWVYRTSIYI